MEGWIRRHGIHDVENPEIHKTYALFTMITNDMERIPIYFEYKAPFITYRINGKNYTVNASSGRPPFGTTLPTDVMQIINELREMAFLIFKHAKELK